MLPHIDGERRAVTPAGQAKYVFQGIWGHETALPNAFLCADGRFRM